MLGGLEMNNLKITDNLTKKVKQGISFALVGTMLISATVRTQAPSKSRDNHRYHELHQTMNTQQLPVSQGINLYLNDHVFIPKDVNGNEVSPFVYNGTTYVPIRAITTALGADVSYANNIASITRKPDAKVNPGIDFREDISLIPSVLTATKNISVNIDGQPFIPRDVNGNIVDIYAVNGTTYVPLRALCDAYHIPVVWDGEHNRIYLGNHINLVDPNIWSNEVDKIKQDYHNLALVAFEQIKIDLPIFHQQFLKFETFMNKLDKKCFKATGSYYNELEQLYSELERDFYMLCLYNDLYDDEFVVEQTTFLSDRMAHKDEMDVAIFYLGYSSKISVEQDILKSLALCDDERIEQLYSRLNDIMAKYDDTLEQGKILTHSKTK